MDSRIVRVLLASFLAVVSCAPAVASPSAGGYEHQWQAQGMMIGEVGATSLRVVDSRVELSYEKSAFRGEIVYSDVLGIRDTEGTVSQESSIELRLTGTSLQGGTAAGGTFSGTATLKLRDAANLDSAIAEEIVSAAARTETYDVGGHWGATLSGTMASGEVIFERAAIASGSGSAGRDAAWFNRAAIANPDMLGDPQLFAARVSGLTSASPGDGDGGEDGDSGTPSDGASSGNSGSAAGTGGESVVVYILKGIRGGDLARPVPIPDELARAARDLADARPVGATPLPDNSVAIDRDIAGAYLDAKNAAAGLLSEDGPSGPVVQSLVDAVAGARKGVAGIAAVDPDEDAGTVWSQRAISALEPRMSSPGAQELADQLRGIAPGADRETVGALRVWTLAAIASGVDSSYGSVLEGTHSVATEVESASLAEGAPSDAVLAAADDPGAPETALVVSGFVREPSLDTSATADGELLPNRVLATSGSGSKGGDGLAYLSSAGPRQVDPDVWLAHRRGDGTALWLAGEGADVALRDVSVRGWAFRIERAALVDASRCGRMLAVFAAR
ncbi:MAG: hypothetical protein Q8K99_09090 [Actinomycetota bacterium]|nr:hypothetical protein [Actinomycetota bacterium]